jgi:sarcosine oxidase, subunit gamma
MLKSEEVIRTGRPAARFIFQGGPAAREAASRGFGVALPTVACRTGSAGDRAALWLGPDEWLLLAQPGEGDVVLAALEDALAGQPHSLVDVTHRQVALSVTGPQARDLLASGCPLDLASESYPVGMCTRTLFAKAEVVLWRRSAEEYHLETGRSFSGYVLGWLREAQRGG